MSQDASPPADLLPVSRKANLAYRAVRLVGVPLLYLCFRFQVSGRENIPREGNYIVIANHLNWLDEFALLLLFPVEPRLHFLANPTLLVTRKFQWWLIRTTGGYVPVVRARHGDPALFKHVDRCLAVGGGGGDLSGGRLRAGGGRVAAFQEGLCALRDQSGRARDPRRAVGDQGPL